MGDRQTRALSPWRRRRAPTEHRRSGIVTGYGHQSRVAVARGQTVSQGDVIGYEGSTGDSAGPHVHFEVRVDNAPRNPRLFIAGNP
jgi:murein DD-endopeptidase MepM/ murein hydrolase activator NlpD